MPNWCDNHMIIKLPANDNLKVALEFLTVLNLFKSEIILNNIVLNLNNENHIIVDFDSRWQRHEELETILWKITQEHGADINIKSCEHGNDLFDEFDNGNITEYTAKNVPDDFLRLFGEYLPEEIFIKNLFGLSNADAIAIIRKRSGLDFNQVIEQYQSIFNKYEKDDPEIFKAFKERADEPQDEIKSATS